jgi:hypothetical protein
MRKVTLWLAVFALSACSGEKQPSPSDVVGPGSPLSESGQRVTLEAGNCTLTQGFWKNHEEAWPVEELILGGDLHEGASDRDPRTHRAETLPTSSSTSSSPRR